MLPRVGVALPGLVTGLAGTGDRVSPPEPLASVGVESVDVGAGALVAAAAGDDQLVVDEKRGRRQRAVAGLEIVELDCLDQFAGIAIGPEDLAIARDRNDKVLI